MVPTLLGIAGWDFDFIDGDNERKNMRGYGGDDVLLGQGSKDIDLSGCEDLFNGKIIPFAVVTGCVG